MMKTLQKPISNNHISAMFFDGVVAESDDKKFALITYQDGEIGFMGNLHIDKDIIELGRKGLIDDTDIDNEEDIDIYVDKFFAIAELVNGKYELVDDEKLIYNEYTEAIEEFEEFLNQ